MRKWVFAFVLVMVISAAAESENTSPILQRELVYSTATIVGDNLVETFSPLSEPNVFLLAEHDAIVVPVKTDVYYWPITQEFLADWAGYEEELEGTLEIEFGGKIVASNNRVYYSYLYNDWETTVSDCLIGQEALDAYELFSAQMDSYFREVRTYYDRQAEYEETFNQLLKKLGENPELVDPEDFPDAPERPDAPVLWVTNPRLGFLVNLNPGDYKLRLRDEKGEIVPGSEKNVVVFTHRQEGIAYEIRPAESWTKPLRSDDLSEVVYVNGERTFYVIPSLAREYDRFKFAKFTNLNRPLAGEGMQGTFQWVPITALSEAALRVYSQKRGSDYVEIPLKAYYVDQVAGSRLGYEIRELSPEELKTRQPHFIGYKVKVNDESDYRFEMVNKDDTEIQGSSREIRTVKSFNQIVFVLAILPLFMGIGLWFWRR